VRTLCFRAIFLAALIAAGSARAASASVSFSFFYQSLAPYGHWVTTASFGQVWAPAVSTGWAPYVRGEWAYTSYGWTWVAADPWGAIPYRYGTWVWIDPHGWVWVPGYVWAPAWVTWAYTDDYIGWAPVPPSFALTASGYYGRPVVVSATRYVFVPARHFVGTPISTVRVVESRNRAILPHARTVTAFGVSGGVLKNVGPAPARIAKVTGRKIRPQPIRASRAQPARFERASFSRGRSMAVASPQRSAPVDEKKAVEKKSIRKKPKIQSRPREEPDRPATRRSAAVEAPRAAPEARKPAKVRSGEPDVARQAVRKSAPKATVEKASKPKPERRAASPAPKAVKAQKPKKPQKPQRAEPDRRPHRDSESQGGLR
jgi:hypothetical protein